MSSPAFPHEEPSVLTPQESELSKKRKKCESLEQEARKKQRRCEELVSSGGPPRSQLPVPQASWGVGSLSAFTPFAVKNTFPPVLRGSPFLADAGSRWGRRVLSVVGRVLRVEDGPCQAPSPELL